MSYLALASFCRTTHPSLALAIAKRTIMHARDGFKS